MAEFDGEPEAKTSPMVEDDIVAEAKARFQLCVDAEDRDDALLDLKFLKGEQWDADAVRQRELDNRPCLTFNNIPAIIHQVTNDTRQNKQSIQVAPVDGGADVKVAEVIEGLIRHIEYDSKAETAYDTATESAARIGFGFFRLVTEYTDPMSFNQDIKIKRIRNSFTVHLDPNAQEADGSDAQYGFISSKMPRAEFVRDYPSAETTGDALGTSTGDNGAEWGNADFVRVAEYYRIEEEPDVLCLMPDGRAILQSEGGDPDTAIVTRPTAQRKVMWYKLTGAEVLAKAEIPCKWIPIFPIYGDEIDVDGSVTRNGIIRNAKAPKQMENYWLTSATEEIAMRTKTPFVGALGQFEGVEADWEAANVRNFPYLEYNPVTIDGTLAPAPQRQAPADVPAGFIQMAGIARDTVKAVTGIYDASLGNRSNEVSGLAIRARQQQGDIANFHYADNRTLAITQCARCIVDMIPKIYDTERVVRILGEDRKQADHVTVNQPAKKQDETGKAVDTVLNDLTAGTYDVTVTTGPAYNTLREEAAANLIELGGKFPKLMEVAGDKVVRAMDFPGAEEIAERLEKTLPPGLRDDDDDEAPPMVQTPKGPVSIEEAGQMIGALDQAMDEMQGHVEKLESGLAKAELDSETKLEIARIQAESRSDVEELKGMITLLTQQISPILAHEAAVVAAADNAHPATPAPIAQGLEPVPAQVAMQETAPDAGSQASAPENE